MSDATKQVLEVVGRKLEELVGTSATEPVKVKLRNIDDVCRQLVVTGKQRLTVPSLLSAYAARYPAKDQAIAESTIRNKRAGGNPYNELYRVWESAAEVILDEAPRSSKVLGGDVMGYDDLAGIADLAVRHQVKLLITRNRSLKSQLDILKQAKDMPAIRLVTTHPDSVMEVGAPQELELTESEIAAVADFLSPSRLKARGLLANSAGVLEARGGRELSDPGFMDALHKVMAHAAKQ